MDLDPITQQLSDAGIVALSPEARMRHLYLLGATGTGKTNLLLRLIESDIKNKRAFCVVDLRGDLVDRILLRLAGSTASELRERLLLVDLRDGGYSTGFNPLVGTSDFYTRALLMLSVLKKQSESWGVQLEDTLRHSLMALAETGWSLLEVRPLLTNAAFRAKVMEDVQDSQVRSYFEEYSRLSQAERNKRSDAVLNKLSPLLSVPALRLMFGQRQGFSFSTLLDNQPGMIILIALGVGRLHDAARLAGGLLISSIQAAIMARDEQPEAQRVPAHLYVDEFECMASDKFEEIVAEGRRFGVGLTLSHQNLSQLPLSLRQVLRNNVHTQVYFQTGAPDAIELAKEIGHGKGSDEVRATLMSQGTGEAYLVRRGQRSARMRTLRSGDPQITDDQIRQVRATAFDIYGRPSASVEQELREREAELQNLNAAPGRVPGASSHATAKAPGTAVYEIRHDKLSHFGPDNTQPAASQISDDVRGEAATEGDPERESRVASAATDCINPVLKPPNRSAKRGAGVKRSRKPGPNGETKNPISNDNSNGGPSDKATNDKATHDKNSES